MSGVAVSHAAMQSPVSGSCSCMCLQVWEVSVKLGEEGDPMEKESAGDLALNVTLLVFQVGNSVLAVLRMVSPRSTDGLCACAQHVGSYLKSQPPRRPAP